MCIVLCMDKTCTKMLYFISDCWTIPALKRIKVCVYDLKWKWWLDSMTAMCLVITAWGFSWDPLKWSCILMAHGHTTMTETDWPGPKKPLFTCLQEIKSNSLYCKSLSCSLTYCRMRKAERGRAVGLSMHF